MWGKNIPKVSNYLNHFEYHVMTGGTINNEIITLINRIHTGIDKINTENTTYKTELDSLSSKLEEFINKNDQCEKDKEKVLTKLNVVITDKANLTEKIDQLEEKEKQSKSWFK